MKIKCNCGETVVEGKIERNDKRKKVFIIKEGDVIGHKEEWMFGQKVNIIVREDVRTNGEIHKNKSNNPDNWTGLCSKCQSTT